MRPLLVLAALCLSFPSRASAADCGAMAVNRITGRYYWAGGDCSNYGANALAFRACNHDDGRTSHECTGAHMDSSGRGSEELSKCGNKFMSLACKVKDTPNGPRYLCRLGCAWSEADAKKAAMRDCNTMFGAGSQTCIWQTTIDVRGI